MRTQLFIQIPTNEPGIILNPNFTDGLNNWTIQVSTADNEYGVCYPAVTGSSFVMYQDNIILKTGWYLVKFTIVPPKDGTLDGILTFGLAQDVDEYASTVGEHKVYMNVTTLTDNKIYIATTGVFNGGITNISIEGINGDWKEIDLNGDEDIALNLQISDISDISSKNSSFSREIILPGTKNNNDIFRHVYNISTYNGFELNKDVRCRISQDTLPIFEGSFELVDINIEKNDISYTSYIFSQNYTLFNKIGDKFLRGNKLPSDDLDFSEYTHKMNATNIIASWDNLGSAYTYGCINKQCRSSNQFTSSNTFKVDEMSPALFIKEIFDKILRKAGFIYQSEFLESDYFKSLVYPLVQRWMYMNENDTNKYLFSGQNTGDYISGTTVHPETNYRLVIGDYYYQNDIIEDDDLTVVSEGSMNCYDSGVYTVKQSGYYNIDFEYKFDINLFAQLKDTGIPSASWQMSTSSIEVAIYHSIIRKRGATETILSNGGQEERFALRLDSVLDMDYNWSETLLENSVFSFKQDLINLLEDDEIIHRVRLVLPFTYQSFPSGFWRTSDLFGHWNFKVEPYETLLDLLEVGIRLNRLNITSNIELDTRITEDVYYNPTLILHNNIKQSDFISSIIKMFNLYIEDIGNNTLLIEPRDTYYSNPTIVSNWKVNLNYPVIIRNSSDLREKVFSFSHDIDETRLLKEYKRNYTTERIYGEYYKVNDRNKDLTNRQEIRTIFMSVPSTRQMERTNDVNHISYLVTPVIYNDATSPTSINYTQEYKPAIFNYSKQSILNQSSTFRFVLKAVNINYNYYFYHYPYFGMFSNPYEQNTGTTTLHFGTNPDRYYEDYAWNGQWATSNNLYNLYYNNMIKEYLDPDSKIMTCYVDLTPKDIHDFRFSNLILINGDYFRVNKIIDYVVGQPTKVELLTVKNQVFDFEVDERIKFITNDELIIDNKIYYNTNVIQDVYDNIYYSKDTETVKKIANDDDILFELGYGTYSIQSKNSNCYAVGDYSFAIGEDNSADGKYAVSIGKYTYAKGNYSLASGYKTSTMASGAVALGYETFAKEVASFAQGFKTEAHGVGSTSIGNSTIAIGPMSLAQGFATNANTYCSVATGYGSRTYLIGQKSHSSFTTPNRTQAGEITMYCETSGDYPGKALKINGTDLPILKNNTSYHFDVMVVITEKTDTNGINQGSRLTFLARTGEWTGSENGVVRVGEYIESISTSSDLGAYISTPYFITDGSRSLVIPCYGVADKELTWSAYVKWIENEYVVPHSASTYAFTLTPGYSYETFTGVGGGGGQGGGAGGGRITYITIKRGYSTINEIDGGSISPTGDILEIYTWFRDYSNNISDVERLIIKFSTSEVFYDIDNVIIDGEVYTDFEYDDSNDYYYIDDFPDMDIFNNEVYVEINVII